MEFVWFLLFVVARRNKEQLSNVSDEPRARQSHFSRFIKALRSFLNTHTFSVDPTESSHIMERRGGGGLGGGGGLVGGGGFGYNKQALKKEAKYAQYAFMVLLGIFGLTGPLLMKTLAVLAAKALVASKMALIIVGSIALKKFFEKGYEKTSVKIHTVTSDDDDHDRNFLSNQHSLHWFQSPYHVQST